MSNKLDLDLNSIIATERSQNKSQRGGGSTTSSRGRGASTSRGKDRRHNPLDRRQSQDGGRRRESGSATQSTAPPPQDQNRVRGDTIFVSGLDRSVNQDDVYDIFNRVGTVKSATVNYDQHGQSLGTAEVTFRGGRDAETAVKEYDGAEVDGKVMNVKLIGSFVKTKEIVKRQTAVEPAQRGGRRERQVSNTGRGGKQGGGESRRGGGSERGGRGGARGGSERGASRGGRRERSKPANAEDLDAEMDAYQSSRGAAAATKEE